DRMSPAMISTVGLSVLLAGQISLACLPAQPQVWDIAARCLLCGISFGCFQSPNNREMLSNVSREHSGYASGVLAIIRTCGQCGGAALVGLLRAAHLRDAGRALGRQAVQPGLSLAAVATALAIVLSLGRRRGTPRRLSPSGETV